MTVAVESLALLCPTAVEADLLRACLWSGAPARQAWQRWQRAVGDPGTAFARNVSGVKSLLPQLHRGLRHSGADAPATVRAALGTAALAEALRHQAYTRIAVAAIDALAAAGVPFLLLRGAALAVTVYPEPALRHSHDVDILIGPPDRSRATEALRRAGFTRGDGRPGSPTVVLRDPSGMPLALHQSLYRFAYYTPPLADVWRRAQPCDFGGRPVRMLAAADQLLHICGHASTCASRDGLKWVADAWYLLARQPQLDWSELLAAARASRLDLPVATLLHYLAADMEAPVPGWVLERLHDAAAQADRTAREVALSGLRAGRRGTFRNLFAATSTWGGRFELMRWMLSPTPAALRLGEPLRYPRAWPAYYLARPLAYLGRRTRALLPR